MKARLSEPEPCFQVVVSIVKRICDGLVLGFEFFARVKPIKAKSENLCQDLIFGAEGARIVRHIFVELASTSVAFHQQNEAVKHFALMLDVFETFDVLGFQHENSVIDEILLRQV